LYSQPIGKLFEGERRFDIVARFSRERLSSPEALGRIPIFTQDGRTVPLSQVADITIKDGQTLVARQDGVRRLTVRCDIQGRDQGGFVEDAQREFRSQLKVPDGYTIAWLGMFENLTRAKQHFMIVMPITILLIYILLYATFKSQKAALLLLASVPFAFVGAVLGLYLRSMNFNVSTAVGFAALFGVSIMNGVLMVRSIAESQSNGQPLQDAIILGSRNCLRPILLASLVAVLGLLPASLAQGLGSDIQRPLATVIVYGLTSAALLSLFVVPVLYHLVQPKIHIESNHSV
jgi:cobalt-zinc-cadmium resistance protein CzcA